jgi:hypothetical protein
MGCLSRSSKLGKRDSSRNRLSVLLLATSLLIPAAGCTRHFFRQRADCEVAEVLSQKDVYPEWKLENSHVYPDPRARFADPTNPDRPPMPPDDPAAMDLSPNPQKPGKAGVGRVEGTGYLDLLAMWDTANRSEDPENLPEAIVQREEADAVQTANARRLFRIKLEQAAELGLINSRLFQDQREDLYLAALPVTQERFAFAAQFFDIETAIREWTGRDTPEGQHNRWRINSTAGFTKLFSTGALLLFRIANQTVIELTGPLRGTTSQSTLSLDLIQPLLRGGGQAVTLEPLTQTERDLLYAIRNYARFREEFFVGIAGGPDTTSFADTVTLTASGGVVRSPGNSGIVPGTFTVSGGDIGHPQLSPTTAGALNLSGGVAARVEGYLPTLLLAARLVDQRRNVTTLEDFFRRFQAFKEGGDVTQLQVDQVEDQLLQGRIAVLQAQESLRVGLVQFMLQLGLPANTALELDDSPVRSISRQLQRFDEVFSQFKAAQDEITALDSPETVARLRGDLHRLGTSMPLVAETRFKSRLPVRWKEWEALKDPQLDAMMRQLADERRKLLDKKTELEKKNQSLSPAEQERQNVLEFEIALGSLERNLRIYEGQPWKTIQDPDRQQRRRATLFLEVASDYFQLLGKARLERLEQIRQAWPKLPSLCVADNDLLEADLDRAQTIVAQTALIRRFDLMNQRAQLVDAWRQITVFANALLGSVNVEYHMDTFTPAGQAKPFAFGGSRTRNQLILNAEPPLVRVVERNNYRASLIAYQRQRRALMAAEDDIAATVQQEIRQLREFAQDYKIIQRSVELAYLEVENALDTFYAPPAPSAGPASAGNAAALTQQLLAAQSRVPTVQDQLYTFWLSYQTVRLQLFRDLELMPLDYRGVWIDDVASCANAAEAEHRPCVDAPQPPSELRDHDGQGQSHPEGLPRPRLQPPS